MGEARTSVMQRRATNEQRAGCQLLLFSSLLAAHCALLADGASAAAPTETAAQAYNPSWADELNWANQPLWAKPTGASAWLEDLYKPWWQCRVAIPITDYTP